MLDDILPQACCSHAATGISMSFGGETGNLRWSSKQGWQRVRQAGRAYNRW
ncbi:hypothetical protein [Granulicella sp. WH15]|uniref:hypothetical protein n=1 Tax=Granulicella sp. WH15 TaxID=2602070 RepID=UPI002106362C|nr:hypothetical protein [Granulicella sp. WH15]